MKEHDYGNNSSNKGRALGQLKRRMVHSLTIPKEVRGKGEMAR